MSNYTDAESEWMYKCKLSRENKVILCEKCYCFTSVFETVIDFDTFLNQKCCCGGKRLLINFDDRAEYKK